MVFPARNCKFCRSVTPFLYCDRNKGDPVNYCTHKTSSECDFWISAEDETEEQTLERIIYGDYKKQSVIERMDEGKTIAERIQNGVKTPGDFMEYLSYQAKEWMPGSLADINRNHHMNNCGGKVETTKENQDLIDAAITAFLNHVGASFCMDYGIYADDLCYERKPLGSYKCGEDPWVRE